MAWKRAKPAAVVLVDDLVRELDRGVPSLDFLVGLVGAPALLAIEADALVVVAGDGRDVSAADRADDLVRPRRVADQIPETEYVVGAVRLDRLEHRSQRGNVGVDVAQNPEFTDRNCPLYRRSAMNTTREESKRRHPNRTSPISKSREPTRILDSSNAI